jgi:hypothetical protein
VELSQSLTQTARTETASARRSPALTSDFDTFLKMLTTQMQNQDPLNPMESTDFAVQLATFSGVEQQVLTNDLLKDLNGQFTLMGMSQLSAWVGKEARTNSDVWYDGRAIPIIPSQRFWLTISSSPSGMRKVPSSRARMCRSPGQIIFGLAPMRRAIPCPKAVTASALKVGSVQR